MKHNVSVTVHYEFFTNEPLTPEEEKQIREYLVEDPFDPDGILDGMADLDNYDAENGIKALTAISRIASTEDKKDGQQYRVTKPVYFTCTVQANSKQEAFDAAILHGEGMWDADDRQPSLEEHDVNIELEESDDK